MNESIDKIKSDFSTINQYAHEKGFEIFVDVSPKVFDKLSISYQDLTFLKTLVLMASVWMQDLVEMKKF